MGQMGSAPFASTRRRRRDGGAFSPLALFGAGEAGGWWDPSDLTPEKVSWRRNLLTWTEQFDNSAWTKTNASILSNLAFYSQDFDNAVWFKGTESTVTANTTTAPDGTTTADSIFETANTSAHGLSQSIAHSASINTTTQIRVKPNGRTRVSLYAGGSADLFGAVFDLVGSGSVVSDLTGGTATLTSRSIAALADGWYLLTIVGVRGANASSTPVLALHQGTGTPTTPAPSYTGDVTKGVFLWGAQLVPGTTAQTYTPTTSAIAPIQFTDPFGSATADKLVENTATAVHQAYQNYAAVAAGGPVTFSVFAKAAERTVVTLLEPNGLERTFNLATGVATGSGASMVDVGNGWWRCIASATFIDLAVRSYAVRLNNGTTTNYTGDGTSGVLIWGAQLEAAPTASSYQRITDFTSDFLAAFPQHALYQDSAGTTPVTALGQPVGLVLDKSKGGLANLGPELVTNGDFSSGTTGWAVTRGTMSVVNGALTATATAAYCNVYQNISTVAGRTYWITLNGVSATSGKQVNAYAGTTLGTADLGAIAITPMPTSVRLRFTAVGSTTVFFVQDVGTFVAGDTFSIDNVSIREVPGSHLIQATSASRPTCDARVNLLTYSEQFDNAAWVAIGAKNVTANTSVAPDGTLTADTLTDNSAAAFQGISQTITIASGTSAYVTSIFVLKTTGGTSATFGINGTLSGGTLLDFTVRLNTDTGAQATTGSGVTTVVIDAGQYWRVVTTATNSGGNTSLIVRLYPATNVNGVLNADSSAATGSAVIWGADLRLASDAAFPYQRVVTASDYADVQAPRYLTFDGIDDSLYTAASVDFATWTSGTRRNLLLYPSAFDNAWWAKSAGGGGSVPVVTANDAVAPDGTQTADRVVFAAPVSGDQSFLDSTGITTVAGVSYTHSVYIKAYAAGDVGKVVLIRGAGSAGYQTITLTDTWQRVSRAETAATTTSYVTIGLRPAIGGSSGTVTVHLWGAQLELGSTATTFQDVGTDKVTVVTGVRKLSDTALGMFAEFSSIVDTNNGTFYLVAPRSGSLNDFQLFSKGTVGAAVNSGSTYPAPTTRVWTMLSDIGADSLVQRVDAVVTTNNGDQGAGTFGTYVLYVGRRNNASLPFNGRLYQLIVRGAATDTATVQQTERFVAGKTGVTL